MKLIELDRSLRELTIPTELADALAKHPTAKQAFDELSYTNHKRHTLAVESAKTDETKQRRSAKPSIN